jgi:coenzyme F420-0:L-glutamate ligase/coenzyme F420-1:gamma-L-glutamate ligase
VDEGSRAFVAEARVAHLATASADGVPHVVPVCFVLVGDRIFVALDEKPKTVAPRRLRRVRNILENPKAQLLVDRYDEDWSRLVLVQLSGEAAVVEPGAGDHATAIRFLRQKYAQYGEMDLESRPLIALRIQSVNPWAGS